MGHFPLVSARLSKLSIACLGLLSVSAYADEAKGLAWLQNQSESAVTASHIANSLQALSETSLTLNHIAGSNTSFDVTELQKKTFSTESLSRFALLAHFQNADAATKAVIWTQLKDLQNDDGGFGHLQGWQSNPLDTAFVLLALTETQYADSLSVTEQQAWQTIVANALNYLATQQRSDGSYQVVSLDNLYVSSYVLSALSGYVQFNPQITPKVQNLVSFLKDKQVSAGKWSEHPQGLFIDALVSESLHPYSDGNTAIQDSFKQRALAAQQADGSWENDAYVTAIVLDALDQQSKDVTNPISSSISLSVVDSETNLPLQGAVLTSNANSPSQVSITSDADGKLAINNAEAGLYQFELTRDGYSTITFEVNLKQGERLNLSQIKLSRDIAANTAQIQGKVTDSVSGVGIANAQVTVVMVDDNGQALPDIAPIIVKTGTNGNYQAVLPQAGKFGIDVRREGFIPVSGSGTATAGGVLLFNPKLTNESNFSASVQGMVQDGQGQPLANATIVQDNQTIATTDAQGKFMINNASYGSQSWTVTKAGYTGVIVNFVINQPQAYDVGTLTIQAKTSPSDPDVAATGLLTISVVDADSLPVGNYQLTAEKLDASGNVIQTQRFEPNAEINSNIAQLLLTEGKWRITGEHPAYDVVSREFTITANTETQGELVFGLKPYGIAAKVVDSQTNQIIANAPFTVVSLKNDTVLFRGNTNTNGFIVVPTTLLERDVRVDIAPENYLATQRYLNVDSVENDVIDMGEVRIRPTSAEVILPDLKIIETDATQLTTDQQALNVSGSLTAKLVNVGNADVSQNITLTAFEDANYNRQLDEGEQILGTAELTDNLAYQKDNADDTHANVTINISGTSQFREAPIAIMVDSDSQLAEKDEDNNIRYTSDGIEIKPEVGTFEPEVVWHWKPTTSSPYPSFNQVMASPVVAPLKDTNGNNKIDVGDAKYVLFTSFESSRYRNADGVLRILNAKDGSEVQSYGKIESDGFSPAPSGNISLADLNNDGIVEIIVTSQRGLSCYDIETGFKWHTDFISSSRSIEAMNYSAPSIFDVDNDGEPEIILGKNILDKDGALIYRKSPYWEGKSTDVVNPFHFNNQSLMISNGVVFDLKNRRQLSRLHGSSRYSSAAILNTDDDNAPEIITASRRGLSLYELDGTKVWGSINITSRNAGTPIIADMDGDSKPDIGIATENDYIAFRSDGSQLWSIPVYDYSSSVTSSTVFDFENDGNAEVLYADERYFRIIEGPTGKIKYELENTSGTLFEAPVIADGDSDGHADIFVISNNYSSGSRSPTGIRMLSGKNKDWADTRHIWNQHNYHITNINDDMTVPAVEEPSWLVHNTYRLNTKPNSNVTAASDLTASYIRVTDRSIVGDSEFTVRVGNAGGKPVKAGTPVSFYRIPQVNGAAGTPELVGTVELTKDLVGGNIAESYEDVTLKYNGSLADFGEVVIVANDAGAGLDSATGVLAGTESTTKVIQEFSRDNNTARLAVDGGWVSLTLDGSVDGTAYGANKDVTITAIPSNLGSFPSSPTVKTQIIDSAGNVIATLPDQPVDLTSALIPDAGNSQTLTQTWNTGSYRTGNYQARITLWTGEGDDAEQVAVVDRPFSIITEGAALGLTDAAITTDKVNYTANDLVSINSRLQNKASNQVATRRDVTVKVKDPDGQVIFTQTYSYNELAPNALRDQAFELSLKDAKAGSYTVTQTVVAPDGSQANQVSSTTFGVQSSAQSGVGIAGSIAADKAQVELGNNVTLNWSINNLGDVDLTGLPVRIELFKGDSTTAFTTIPVNPADISQGGNIAKSVMWNAVGNNNDQITAVLVANFAGTDRGLAVTNFTLIEPPIEAVINKTDAITEPLLVYYSCENGWYTFAQNWSLGKFNYPCFDVRENYLKDYLNRLEVPYKLVKTPWAFRHELQSGKFENIWLLGAVEKLSPHTYKELREAAFMGDNVLVDSGAHSWLNHKLFHLAGMNYRGRLQLALPKDGGGDITLNPPLFTDPVPADLVSIPLNTQTRRKGYPFESNWAVLLEKRPTDSSNPQIGGTDVTATFNGAHKLDLFLEWIESIGEPKGNEDNYYNQPLQTYPAITQGTYGNGKPVALSFDLIHSLTLATSNGTPATDDTGTVTRPNLSEQRWDGALKQLLKPRQVNASNYLPLEPVRIPVVVNNKGSNDKTVTVTVEMPQGAMWLDTKGGATLADAVELKPSHIQGTHTYQVTVPAKSQHSDILTLRLPKNTGTHGVRVSVSTDQNGQSNVLDQQELRYVVRGVQERIDLLKSTVDDWSVFSQNGFQVINLKTQLGLIKSHYKHGNLELAVYEAARMGTTFSEMQNTSDRDIKALRLEGDELLRALQMQWYQSRNNVTPLP